MRSLICAFVVRIWHKTCFLMARLKSKSADTGRITTPLHRWHVFLCAVTYIMNPFSFWFQTIQGTRPRRPGLWGRDLVFGRDILLLLGTEKPSYSTFISMYNRILSLSVLFTTRRLCATNPRERGRALGTSVDKHLRPEIWVKGYFLELVELLRSLN